MPPKKEDRSLRDELIEIFRDQAVIDSIAKALAPTLARAIDAAIDARLAELDSTVSDLKRDSALLTAENKLLSDRLSTLENYVRRDQLIITGIPELTLADRATPSASADALSTAQESPRSVLETVVGLCEKLGVDIDERDISNAHRLKAGPKDKHRPIIVSFVAKRVRNAVYAAKKSLKGISSGVFISEHLTKEAAALYYETRKLVRNKELFATWTQGGVIYIRRTSDATGRPQLVKDKGDLARALGRASL